MAWPRKRQKTALVFVDFMNLYLAKYNAYQGPCTDIHVLLQSVMELGYSLAEEPSAIIYLDALSWIQKNSFDLWIQIQWSCRQLGITIRDVKPVWGKDQVDSVIIRDMETQHRLQSPAVPFLLVSADRGFIDTVRTIALEREVYIGLPLYGTVPSLARAGNGWHFVHQYGWILAALGDLLDDFPRMYTPKPYIRARFHLRHLLSRLRPYEQQSWGSLTGLRPVEMPMTDEELFSYLDLLVQYGILEPHGSDYLVLDHRLVGRPIANQKPAFQR